MRILYTILLYLVQPLFLLYLFKRSRKAKAYKQRINERYGFYANLAKPKPKPKPKPNGILIHAASVGESIAIIPLIKQLRIRYPEMAITITNVTPTGSAQIRASLKDDVTNIYLAYDLPDAISRMLDFVKPKLCLIVETEIWPNLIYKLDKRKIPCIIINARLSLNSFKGYKRFSFALRDTLNKITSIAAQDDINRERYIQLGIPDDKIVTTGNLKYDLTISQELSDKISTLHTEWQLNRPVWIAASTHKGEEELILAAHKQLLTKHPDLLLILVPRHPERFDSVATLIEEQGLTYLKRTDNQAPNEQQVLLGDTMGELLLFYSLANIAFVGGSLVPMGGHNLLEPLLFKIPTITGNNLNNFTEIAQKLQAVNGIVIVENKVNSIAETVDKLLNDSNLANQSASAGFQVLHANQGALNNIINLITPYLTN